MTNNITGMDNYVLIPVYISKKNVPSLYSFLGSLPTSEVANLAGEASQGDEQSNDPTQQAYADWQPTDIDQAFFVYSRITDGARRVFDVMIENPDVRFSSEELAEMAGVPGGGSAVAGTLSWPGKYCFSQGRKVVYITDPRTGRYGMNAVTAEVFSIARDVFKHGKQSGKA